MADMGAAARAPSTPGTGLPRVIALGTWRYSGGHDFVAVYGGRGVIVTLAASPWSRLLAWYEIRVG